MLFASFVLEVLRTEPWDTADSFHGELQIEGDPLVLRPLVLLG